MISFHPYADIFDLIDGPDFEAMVADVRKHGIRERIKLLDGKILDGRNRYRAALATGLFADDDEAADKPSAFEKFLPEIDGNPLDYVFSKNVHRRHLTTGQRSYAMAEYERFRHGGPRPAPAEQDANLQVDGGPTRAELAQIGHVSERSIASAAVVRDRGVDDLKTAVKRGDIAVSAAERIARLPRPSQLEEIARALPNGARAIMGSRIEPDDSLDYFPTPPWATRALLTHVWPRLGAPAFKSAWEPACGEGHIAEVLCEQFDQVVASDIFGYGYGAVLNFYDDPPFGLEADWIITNPPFRDDAETFVIKALERARVGVAMFLRLQWLESIGRYERIFAPRPPAIIAQFAERVPLHKGRWEPEGATATAYLWIVWLKNRHERTEFFWIPPGCRDHLTRADDAERFTAHPVVKCERTATADGAPIDNIDPSTGEVLDSDAEHPAAHSIGEEPAVASAPCSAAAGSMPEEDDLEIPAFLRRQA